MRLVTIKAVVFGLMVALVIFVVLYDKLFFNRHYYQTSFDYLHGHLGLNVKHEFG